MSVTVRHQPQQSLQAPGPPFCAANGQLALIGSDATAWAPNAVVNPAAYKGRLVRPAA